MFAFALSLKECFTIPWKFVLSILFLRLISYKDEIIGGTGDKMRINTSDIYTGYDPGRQKCFTAFSVTLVLT
jgi:hypothetical protein